MKDFLQVVGCIAIVIILWFVEKTFEIKIDWLWLLILLATPFVIWAFYNIFDMLYIIRDSIEELKNTTHEIKNSIDSINNRLYEIEERLGINNDINKNFYCDNNTPPVDNK